MVRGNTLRRRLAGGEVVIGPFMNCTDLIYLAVNDYVEMMLWHSHSSALIFAANSTMSVTWAGA